MADAGTATIGEKRTRFWVRFSWLAPLLILLLALLVRLAMVPDVAYRGDVNHLGDWINLIRNQGLFQFYNSLSHFASWDRTYPALSIFLFQITGAFTDGTNPTTNPTFVFLIKIIPTLFELAIVAAAYLWLREDKPSQPGRSLRLVIPALLAIYPGLIAISSWWGQYEAPYVLCLVISLIALNRDRPLVAWFFFALAVMFKQPALVFGPLLLIYSFRRYGWQIPALGIGICVVVGGLLTLPFAVGGGMETALSPFLKAGDLFPFLSNNAYNLWYGVAYVYKGVPMPLFDPAYKDTLTVVGPLTAKTLGFILFGAYVLFMMVLAWIDAGQRREFVMAAALYMSFFMLPTQVHERYLYPAAVLSVFALAQDKRMWPIAGVLAITFTYNVLGVVIPYYNNWKITAFGVDTLAFPTALANILILVTLTGIVLLPRHRNADA